METRARDLRATDSIEANEIDRAVSLIYKVINGADEDE